MLRITGRMPQAATERIARWLAVAAHIAAVGVSAAALIYAVRWW